MAFCNELLHKTIKIKTSLTQDGIKLKNTDGASEKSKQLGSLLIAFSKNVLGIVTQTIKIAFTFINMMLKKFGKGVYDIVDKKLNLNKNPNDFALFIIGAIASLAIIAIFKLFKKIIDHMNSDEEVSQEEFETEMVTYSKNTKALFENIMLTDEELDEPGKLKSWAIDLMEKAKKAAIKLSSWAVEEYNKKSNGSFDVFIRFLVVLLSGFILGYIAHDNQTTIDVSDLELIL